MNYPQQNVSISTVRAKFVVNYVQDAPTHKVVHFNAVYDGSEENKSFSSATPGAYLSMTISEGTPAYDYFKQGQEIYLDFKKAN